MRVLECIYGFWGSAIFAAGLRHRIFQHVADGADTAQELANRAGISLRGAQATLDGLVGLGLIRVGAAGYENSPAATTYLVPGTMSYMGGYADMILSTMADWVKLPESVATGEPISHQQRADPQNSFWANLVPAIAPVCFPPAHAAARRLGIADKGAFRVLDIGGGSGAYAAVWQRIAKGAHFTQLDWPNVNAIAHDYIARFGDPDRFATIDGDMERVEIPARAFDYAIYSNVAHGILPGQNIAMFRRIRSWLKDDGTLVISSLVPNDDRTGDPVLMLFNANLLLNSDQGTTYLRHDYASWLREGGFSDIRFESVPDLPSTLIYASGHR